MKTTDTAAPIEAQWTVTAPDGRVWKDTKLARAALRARFETGDPKQMLDNILAASRDGLPDTEEGQCAHCGHIAAPALATPPQTDGATVEHWTAIARKWIKPDSESSPEFYWGDFYDCVREILAATHAPAMAETRDAEILRTLIHRTHACDLKFDKQGKVRELHAIFRPNSEPGLGMMDGVRRYLDAFMDDAAIAAASGGEQES
jgi:hypothetical protein